MHGNMGLWEVIHRLKFPDHKPDYASIAPWVALLQPFEWRSEQIAKLFDSIMRGFPIGTLLIWHTDAAVKHHDFISDWSGFAAVAATEVQQNTGVKDIVLDGYQRLQSLLIGLAGSYNGCELHFDVTSGEEGLHDGIRYRFAFKDASVSWPWVRFKNVVGEMSRDRTVPLWSSNPSTEPLSGARTKAERILIAHNVERAIIQFTAIGEIRFQRVVRDSHETAHGASDTYTAEEAAEIFRRINAGGAAPRRSWFPSLE